MKKILLCVCLAACGRGGNGSQTNVEFTDAAPDVEALTLDEDNVETSAARDEVAPFPTIAGNVKGAVKQLNDGVKAVLGHVDAMTKAAPSSTGSGVRTWTLTKDGLDYQLSIKKIADGVFGWRMEAKKSADADYQVIMGGKIKRRGTDLAPRQGAGYLGIDLTKYKAIAEGTPAAITKEGKLFAAFRRGPGSAHLVYRLKEFKDGDALPMSVYFSGFRLFRREVNGVVVPPMGFVRAGGRLNVTDFPDLAAAENEIVTARLRRVIGHGGWGRAVIRGGNLPEGTKRIVRECWNSPATGNEALYLREVWDCTGTFDAATKTYPSCAQRSEFHYPALTTPPAGDPEAPATKQRFLAQCFPDAAARIKLRLQQLAASEPPVPEEPAAADGADETAPAADEEQDSAPPVENEDANVIESATNVEDL